jgi:hypothetical protein
MKKSELIEKITGKGGTCYKSWTIAKLNNELERVQKNLNYTVFTSAVNPGGNWNTAKDWFPRIEVNQGTREITVECFRTIGHQKKASVDTESIVVDVSEDRTQAFVRGEVSCKNWQNLKCSGSQKFCFALFVGDSGHVYTHRAPATKGWMDANPDTIRKRLRKLGIGRESGIIQQGDFLLKPANGSAHPDENFRHERMGFGHHNFEGPVLYHDSQFFLSEATKLTHTAVDGIQHPDVIVPAGKWIVGTTASQLRHTNARD